MSRAINYVYLKKDFVKVKIVIFRILTGLFKVDNETVQNILNPDPSIAKFWIPDPNVMCLDSLALHN